MKRWVGILLAALEVAAAVFVCAACARKISPQTDAELYISGMKTDFAQGEAFETGELEVAVLRGDNSVARLTPEEYTVDSAAYKAGEAGNYEIKVGYAAGGLTASYTVTVKGEGERPQFQGKHITAEGGKELFYLGEEFSAEGLRVILHGATEGETREAAPGEYEVDDDAFKNNVEGDYPIVVTMDGYSASYTVKVRTDYTESLKILAVGNSFSDDATAYLYDIAKSYGVKDVRVGNMFVGGCSLKQHRGFAEKNQAAYEYRKNMTGTMVTTPNYRLSDALRDEDWDIVVLQQASPESGINASYGADLDYMIQYVTENRTVKDGKLAWHMTWAYQQDSGHGSFPNYDRSQRVMYESIVNAVRRNVVEGDRFDVVFPSGTAIQNARTSYLGDRLTRDGYHLSLDTGRYIAALTWFLALTGKDAEELSYASLPAASVADVEVIKESVEEAIRYPFSVSQSSYPGTGSEYDLTQYERLSWEAVTGYRDATDAAKYAEVMANPAFAASKKRFTKAELPVGALLVLKDGWRYRPEAWSAAEAAAVRRQDNVLAKYVVVDETWWEGFVLRGFNVSTVTGEDVSDRLQEAADALRIYVPKPVAYK